MPCAAISASASPASCATCRTTRRCSAPSRPCAEQAGRLDVLVNNAGLGGFGKVEDLETARIDQQLDTNVRGLILCTQQAIPAMKQQNAEGGFGGHLVNVASIAGLIGNPNLSVYNATKFAVRGLSEAWMKELRADGIKVTCLFPGQHRDGLCETAAGKDLKGGMEPKTSPRRSSMC